MQKCNFKNGRIYYQLTAVELSNIGGLGICDECGRFSEYGYLIPVLNHYQCPDCFSECHLHSSKRRYPEDDSFENKFIRYYESSIPFVNCIRSYEVYDDK